MRPTCIDCAGKHLAQCEELLKELNTGYPAFHWRVIGQLAEAEEETVRDYPELANEIREHRVAWWADHSIIIPFEELFAKLDEILESEEQSVESDPDAETQRIDYGERGVEGTEGDPVGEFGATEGPERKLVPSKDDPHHFVPEEPAK